MENRNTTANVTAQHSDIHSTKSVPSIKEVLALLLDGMAIDHQDIIQAHDGQQHRLGIAIHRLRHKYGFGHLIECPKGKNHPLQYKYFIANKDIPEAIEIAKAQSLLMDKSI